MGIDIKALIGVFEKHLSTRLTVRTVRGYVNNLSELVTEELLENWQELLPGLSDRLFALGFSPATVQWKLGHLRRFFEWGSRWAEFDPRAVDLVPLVLRDTPDPDIPSADSIRQGFRSACMAGPDYATAFALFQLTGVRLRAGFGLEVQDVNLERSILHVRPSRLRRLKNSGSARDVPICAALHPLLAAQVERALAHKRALIFPMNHDSFYGRVKGPRPHALRRAFASALLDGIACTGSGFARVEPVHQWRVARLMGHTSLGTMQSYYNRSGGVPGLHPDEFRESALDHIEFEASLELSS